MRDAVDEVIEERRRLERGFPRAVLLSGLAHAVVTAVALGASILLPRPGHRIRVMDGRVVALPGGGGGRPDAGGAPAPAPVGPPLEQVRPAEPAPGPAPKILKPPREEPRQGLPAPEGRSRRPTRPDAARAPAWTPEPPDSPGTAASGAGQPRGLGGVQGLETLPIGPGVGHLSFEGDWYLGSVQRKIWLNWMQQIRAGMTQPVTVVFTLASDGSVKDVQVTQSGGSYLLDAAAQRAVVTAAPFAPFPKDYGTKQLTIQCIFRPNP